MVEIYVTITTSKEDIEERIMPKEAMEMVFNLEEICLANEILYQIKITNMPRRRLTGFRRLGDTRNE